MSRSRARSRLLVRRIAKKSRRVATKRRVFCNPKGFFAILGLFVQSFAPSPASLNNSHRLRFLDCALVVCSWNVKTALGPTRSSHTSPRREMRQI
eukprot:304002-Pyramimonas_sp.AAC.1